MSHIQQIRSSQLVFSTMQNISWLLNKLKPFSYRCVRFSPPYESKATSEKHIQSSQSINSEYSELIDIIPPHFAHTWEPDPVWNDRLELYFICEINVQLREIPVKYCIADKFIALYNYFRDTSAPVYSNLPSVKISNVKLRTTTAKTPLFQYEKNDLWHTLHHCIKLYNMMLERHLISPLCFMQS